MTERDYWTLLVGWGCSRVVCIIAPEPWGMVISILVMTSLWMSARKARRIRA